jgi:hypothetical protein
MIGKVKSYLVMQSDWHRQKFRAWRDRRRRRSLGLPEFPPAEEVLAAPYYFVLSTGRCGTSFLTEILRRSARLSVHHAPKPELQYLSSLVHRIVPVAASLDLAVLAARFELFVNAYRSGEIYVETNNRITFFAPALARLLPNARFIHLVRNPADFVRSGMRRGYYANGTIQYQRLIPHGNAEWCSYSQLEKITWEWNEINAFIEKFKASMPDDRVLTVRSEDLFRDFETLKSVLEFVGVAGDKRIAGAAAKRALKPINQQKSGSFPKYSHWSGADKAALRRLALLGPKYGYEYL